LSFFQNTPPCGDDYRLFLRPCTISFQKRNGATKENLFELSILTEAGKRFF